MIPNLEGDEKAPNFLCFLQLLLFISSFEKKFGKRKEMLMHGSLANLNGKENAQLTILCCSFRSVSSNRPTKS